MTYTSTTQAHRIGAAARLKALAEGAADYIGRTALYVRTVNELGALSDRELADLGIMRDDIRPMARRTVFGA